MTFAAVNYLAVFVAAIAGWLTGAVYYMALGQQWMLAQGKDPETCKAEMAAKKGTRRSGFHSCSPSSAAW